MKAHSEYLPITVLPRIQRPRVRFIQIGLLPINDRKVSISKPSFAGNKQQAKLANWMFYPIQTL